MGEPDGQPEFRLGKHRGRYCVVIGRGAGRKRHSLGTDDPHKAQTAFAEYIQQWQRLNRPKTATIKRIFDAYAKDREAEGKDAERIRNAWKRLQGHFGALLPGHVDKAQCRSYAAARAAEGASDGTIHTELTYLRAAMHWAVANKWIAAAPYVWVPQKPPPRNRFLTKAEAKKLIDAAEMPHIKLFIRLALSTAGRAGAILSLTWDRVDLDRRLIDLDDPERPRTNKGRATVPINDALYAALLEAKKGAQTDYVIEWGGERVLSVKKGFATAVKKAGIPRCSPHDLRRTAARWMAEAGVSMDRIAQFLGHENSKITERVYARFSPDYQREAARALEF